MAETVPPKVDNLTPRERQIYLLATGGKSNKYISETLGISINTVETHIKQIKKKLRIGRRGWSIPLSRDDQKDLATS